MSAVKPQKVDETIQSREITINTVKHIAFKDGKNLELTQVEIHLLEFLIKNKNESVDRATIIKAVWGDNYFGDDKILDVNIRRLRMKIEPDPSIPEYLLTV